MVEKQFVAVPNESTKKPVWSLWSTYTNKDKKDFEQCLPQHSSGFPDSARQQVFPDSLFNQQLMDLCPPVDSSTRLNIVFNYSNTGERVR